MEKIKMEDLELVSLSVQINGVAYFVNLGQDQLKFLVSMSAGLSDNGKLNLVKALDSYKLTTLNNIL